MYLATSTAAPTLLAAADLVSGSRSLYTIGVGVLVIGILLAGGIRAGGAFLGGRIGETVGWALTAVVVAVIVGSGYAIYTSAKHTVDRTGITTGQFGQ
ncbi:MULTISPECIES: glycosyl transferase family 39 [Mycobacterium]|uniref:glycosyl transferase family 39 n=1 Tax=Mycobacterium TaxID=1763 RepID=UPI000CC9B389|nr:MULTISPECIES: glycosyl transferase family 39 [Mycobacterium]PJE01595.1 MAG: glycosyl transferase family 39 [Mycobacterium sp.]